MVHAICVSFEIFIFTSNPVATTESGRKSLQKWGECFLKQISCSLIKNSSGLFGSILRTEAVLKTKCDFAPY